MIKLRGTTEEVEWSKVHPNPWNPNQQTLSQFAATRNALQKYQQVAPLVVRWHPAKSGEYEIIDGEHRHRLLEGGAKVAVHNLGRVTDREAQHLTAVLATTRGRSDTRLLARLVASLADEMPVVEIAESLPQDPDALQDLIKMNSDDIVWDEIAQRDKKPGTKNADKKEVVVFGPFMLPPDKAREVNVALEHVRRIAPETARSEASTFVYAVAANGEEE